MKLPSEQTQTTQNYNPAMCLQKQPSIFRVYRGTAALQISYQTLGCIHKLEQCNPFEFSSKQQIGNGSFVEKYAELKM